MPDVLTRNLLKVVHITPLYVWPSLAYEPSPIPWEVPETVLFRLSNDMLFYAGIMPKKPWLESVLSRRKPLLIR